MVVVVVMILAIVAIVIRCSSGIVRGIIAFFNWLVMLFFTHFCDCFVLLVFAFFCLFVVVGFFF